jgi:cAMP-dependent protein kinase regulator
LSVLNLKGEVKIVWVDRDAFKRLLGPMESILKRNTEKYEKYVIKTI